MAMTKKEQAEFEKARSYRSLRFSDYPTSTDLDAKSSDAGLIVGFAINVSRVFSMGTISSYSPAVYAAWSERNSHGTGNHTAPVTVQMKIDVVPLRVRFRYIHRWSPPVCQAKYVVVALLVIDCSHRSGLCRGDVKYLCP
ncbi:hypothetical protein RFE82_005286 [Klebsiella pneumoniae]|nr:hypothetical protein [Klebsiella pneumoniae]